MKNYIEDLLRLRNCWDGSDGREGDQRADIKNHTVTGTDEESKHRAKNKPVTRQYNHQVRGLALISE